VLLETVSNDDAPWNGRAEVEVGTVTTIFLCGDVMTGRGIDQILPYPGDPTLRESVVTDARTYVTLAERVSGQIPRPVPYAWPWGDALSVLDELDPDIRLINLETAVTTARDFAPGKAVHYRMNPANAGCLTAVRPDVCVLANNHVLDFGPDGLAESLQTLSEFGIRYVGAGLDVHEAVRPAVSDLPGGGRVVTVAAGLQSSGVPPRWSATADHSGVAYIDDLSERSAVELADRVLAVKGPGDVTVVSLHWGSNWGYDVGAGQVRFAHRLIDTGVDVVHGHSSHHPRPVEIYRSRLILYGCGDLVNDYEGIQPFRAFRDDLRLLYFASVDPDSGELSALRMVPMRVRRMRLERAGQEDADWLRSTVEHASEPFGTRIEGQADGSYLATQSSD
jgi:poly-gamma-glutamate capsule biosynthesis protein CapA/YwtB (metallophosphatase superfamily)